MRVGEKVVSTTGLIGWNSSSSVRCTGLCVKWCSFSKTVAPVVDSELVVEYGDGRTLLYVDVDGKFVDVCGKNGSGAE